MKFQQLLYVREVARSNLNVSQASKNLYTSQPGISKQIKLLEEELGIELFERSGKHLVAITPIGKRILEQIEEILALVDGIKHAATEFSNEDYGSLAIATTHTQAKFTLPLVVVLDDINAEHSHIPLARLPDFVADEFSQRGQCALLCSIG